MDQFAAHQRALDAFGGVLSGVRSDQLDAPTPCTEWCVRDLVGHVISGNRRTATGVASATAGDEGLDELVVLYSSSASDAQASFEAPGGMTRTFEFPFGAVPATRVIGMRATDVLAHAWDLARATGQPTSDLDPELASHLLAASREGIRPEFRGPGRPFRDEQPCDPGAPVPDQLAAFLGRQQD